MYLPQRQAVARAYKAAYGRSLVSDLSSELRGSFKAIVLAAMLPRAEYGARCLRKVGAFPGDENSLSWKPGVSTA